MIDKILIRDNAPSYFGTLRVNHDNCAAGNDTRRRLYLTRKASDPDLVLAHCFNCGESGALKDGGHLFTDPYYTYDSLPKEKPDELPVGMIPVMDWRAAFLWFAKYGITPDEMHALEFGFDQDSGRIILPVWEQIGRDEEGNVLPTKQLGYQSRRLYNNSNEPKYLTCKFFDKPLGTTIRNISTDVFPYVVIVEDLLSAVKVSRFVRVAYPLYGSHIRSEEVLELSKMGPVLVWLDNDNAQITKQAHRIAKLCNAFGGNARVLGNYTDPKNYANTQIETILNEAKRTGI